MLVSGEEEEGERSSERKEENQSPETCKEEEGESVQDEEGQMTSCVSHLHQSSGNETHQTANQL